MKLMYWKKSASAPDLISRELLPISISSDLVFRLGNFQGLKPIFFCVCFWWTFLKSPWFDPLGFPSLFPLFPFIRGFYDVRSETLSPILASFCVVSFCFFTLFFNFKKTNPTRFSYNRDTSFFRKCFTQIKFKKNNFWNWSMLEIFLIDPHCGN